MDNIPSTKLHLVDSVEFVNTLGMTMEHFELEIGDSSTLTGQRHGWEAVVEIPVLKYLGWSSF